MNGGRTKTPWGWWEILLETPGYKVKRIQVDPGHRLSYQKHARRKEHWMVVEGEGAVTLDGREIRLATGGAIDIPIGAAHRIGCSSDRPVVFVEIQTGTYFGEDDIVRLEDDYGRARETNGESESKKR